MARRPDSTQARETLHEIEATFDRGAGWVAENPRLVLGVIGVVLVVAAGAGIWTSQSRSRAEQAAAAVSEVQVGYLEAMGADPGALFVEEPANPALARQARETYSARFLAVADEHDGTAGAVSARVEAGNLLHELGDLEAAVAAWRAAVEGAPASSELRALALMRLAGGLEEQGDTAGAAAAWEEAGGIEQPAATFALAQAARCWAGAGDVPRAIAVFERAEGTADTDAIPDHISARLRELRQTHRSAAQG